MKFAKIILGCLVLAAGGCGGAIQDDMTKEQARELGKADWWSDLCEFYGWYGDGVCDDFCPLPDPDCTGGEGAACRADADCQSGYYCRGAGDAGVCAADGSCQVAEDCTLPGNEWGHARCIGYAECQQGGCVWICGQPPEQGPWSWSSMLLAGVESEHPYPNNVERQWVVERQGASGIKLHFAEIDIEPGYDWLLVEADDGSYQVFDGKHQDVWTDDFPGDRLTLTLRSDGSVTGFGFRADAVAIYEQLPVGICNADVDCGPGERCEPHQCFNPYAPCHGDCRPAAAGEKGDPCRSDGDCQPELVCKGLQDDGQGTCETEFFCRPETTPADCESLAHIAVPGKWDCVENQCVWQTDVPEPEQLVFAATDTPLAIPDNQPAGVTSSVSVELLPRCPNPLFTVSLEISHSYAGDLTVELLSPTGEREMLADRQGGGQDDIVIDALDLSGRLEAATGLWTLKVADHAALDRGELRAWSLGISCR